MKKSKPNLDDKVILNVPENPRLHGKEGTVHLLLVGLDATVIGAVVKTPAAATGEFRALWDEMIISSNLDIIPTTSTSTVHEAAKLSGYTGDVCGKCQGCRMKRNGSCLLCLDCGETSGCS